MKKFFTLLFLAIGLTAAAQNSEKYEHFKELRNEADTTGMKQMLDQWGEEDPEYYAAWTNYCLVMAEEAEDFDWLPMAVNWARMGREAFPDSELLYHKLADALYENEQYDEALAVLHEIEEKGFDDGATWYLLADIYRMGYDVDKALYYVEKMKEEGDEYDQDYASYMLDYFQDWQHERDSLAIHPDHDAIRAFAETEAFRELTGRFVACDTTLTLDEMATVYYGNSYVNSHELANLDLEPIQEMAQEGKYREAFDALLERLEDHPVSLYLLMSLNNLADAVEEDSYPFYWKAQNLLNIISYSGVGNKTDSPFEVICINDEYQLLLQIFGMTEFVSQSLVDGPLDEMTFLNSNGIRQTLYFRLTPPYWERLNALSQDND